MTSLNKKTYFTYSMKRNLFFLFFIFIISIVLLGGRIYFIVNAKGSNYKIKVLTQQVNNNVRYNNLIKPKRGTIYDRNGSVLAESVKVYNFIFDPGVLSTCKEEEIEETLNFLQKNYGYKKDELKSLIKNKAYSNYELLATNMDYSEIERDFKDIKNRKYKGLHITEQYKRVYPNDNMLSDALGFVNKNNQGSWGVEETYEKYLKGEEGREFGVINDGNYIENKYIDAVNGNDVVLTIDQTIQYYVEQAIKENLDTNPKNIYVVATNPQNGEVLAMASYPSYNLNKPYDLSEFFTKEQLDNMTLEDKSNFLNTLWRNFIISDTYEPGSTYKPFVLASALEELKVNLSDKYYCNGRKVLYRNTITCWEASGHGDQTLIEALENSCNIAFMEIGEKMGKETYYNYQQLFGFGSKTNIDLIGEGESTLHKLSAMGPVELATSSFGQSFNISPIQLVTSFAALINGGYTYEPHIMKKIVNHSGNIVKVNNSKQIKQVISTKTANITKEALRSVVNKGTAKGVKIEGYDIGGKTGTAEKLPRSAKKYMVSFIGFAPVDNPQILMLVIVDEPDVKKPRSIYAQRIFKNVMEKALPYMNIYPTTDNNENDSVIKE